MNAKKIFRQSSENMQKVTSSANHVELAIQMSDILNLMEVNMEMDLENTTEPPAGHAKGTARVTIKDSEVSADLELYQVEEDGKQVTYSGTNGSWKKESAEGSSENHLGIDEIFFAQEGKALESFHLSEQGDNSKWQGMLSVVWRCNRNGAYGSSWQRDGRSISSGESPGGGCNP